MIIAPLSGQRGRQDATDASDRKLRIGYVSPDFRRHSVAWFFEPLLRAHDRERFEVHCYYNNLAEDDATARIRSEADGFRPIYGEPPATVADWIAEDGIDILVDLAGHTGDNRLMLFGLKPAPVQMTWLGYPGTTGVETIDYRLTDARADPPGAADEYSSETLIRLPDCFHCYGPMPEAPEPTAGSATEPGAVTFGSFNNITKVTPELVGLWSRLLRELPDSRLLLKAKGLQDPTTRGRYEALFAAEGIGSDRLELIGFLEDSRDHLALYGRVDVALDTMPYNGTTTTCEALWMGVPVVTAAGETHAARVGVSLLTAAGAPELIAPDEDGYVALAKALACDLERLRSLRAGLRQRMAASPLTDAPRFTRAVEQAMSNAWRTHLDQHQSNKAGAA